MLYRYTVKPEFIEPGNPDKYVSYSWFITKISSYLKEPFANPCTWWAFKFSDKFCFYSRIKITDFIYMNGRSFPVLMFDEVEVK
jgi:hypothetical protein